MGHCWICKLYKQREVTIQDKVDAIKIVETLVNKAVHNIAEKIDDIYQHELMKNIKIQTQQRCPLKEKVNSPLKQLKGKMDTLLRLAQCVDVCDHTMAEEVQLRAIRQLLETIKRELDSLENAQRNQQKKVSPLLKKVIQDLLLSDIKEQDGTCKCTKNNYLIKCDEDWTIQKHLCTPALNRKTKYLKEAIPSCMNKSNVFDKCSSHDIYHICTTSRTEFCKSSFCLREMKVKQEKEIANTVREYSFRKLEKRCFEMLDNTETICHCYKYKLDLDLVSKQSQFRYALESPIKLDSQDILEYFELELNPLDCAYISALPKWKTISKKIFDAWLNRSTFRSLKDKNESHHLHGEYKSHEIIKDNDIVDLSKDTMSDLGPTVPLREHVNTNNILESKDESSEHLYPKTQRDSVNTVETVEMISPTTIYQRHVFNTATVDLKFDRTSLQEKSYTSHHKDSFEKDILKTIVCHGNRMLSGKSDITVLPVSRDIAGSSEQPLETNVSLNDNNDSSVSDRNPSLFRNPAMPSEIIISSNDGTIFTDRFTGEVSALASTNGMSPTLVYTSELRVNDEGNCDQPNTKPEVQVALKDENVNGNSSPTPSQTSCSGYDAGIPASDLPNPEVERVEIQSFVPLMEIIDKIADGERVPPQITMRYEILRFCTLRSFPKHSKPYITRIAAAGFYFANTDDEVVCYCCARRRKNWREDDNPMEIHRELNPNCSFLLRNSEVNVSVRMSEIQQDSMMTPSRTHQNNGDILSTCDTISSNTSTSTSQSGFATSNSSQNTTPALSSPVTPSSSPVNVTNSSLLPNQTFKKAHFVQTITPSSSSQQLQSNHTMVSNSSQDTPIACSNPAIAISQLSAAGTTSSTAPKYLKYAMKPARLTSFNDCGYIVILPENLATAGFFYAGFGDCVRCFQCGVGLRHWSDEDDPWIEHCRWSRDCLFVKEVKGQEFVNLVQMAVQYSQNQNRNGQILNGNTTGTGTDSSEDAVIEQQMHSNAAQSVLEMGYDPNVIRNAICVLRNANDGQNLSASTLMEKIFELEDEASNSLENDQLAQGTPLSQPNTTSEQTSESNNTQRTSLDRSLPSSNYVSAQSVAIGDSSSTAASSASGSQGTTRNRNKNSQLLEQKKLKEENEQLKQQSLCTKCKNNDVCIVFLPCGHLVTCETCAPSVRYCLEQDCGKYIKGTVRTYLS